MKLIYLVSACILTSAVCQAFLLKEIGDAFKTAGNAIAGTANKVVDAVKPVASTVVEAAKPLANAALDGLKQHAGEIAATAATTAAQALLTSLLGKRDVSSLPALQNTITNMEHIINNEIDQLKQELEKVYTHYQGTADQMLDTPFNVMSQKIDEITNAHAIITKLRWSNMVQSLVSEVDKLVGNHMANDIKADMTKKLMDLYAPTENYLHQIATQIGESLKQTASHVENHLMTQLHQLEESGKSMVQSGLAKLLNFNPQVLN